MSEQYSYCRDSAWYAISPFIRERTESSGRILTRTGSSHGLRQAGTEDLVIIINYEQ